MSTVEHNSAGLWVMPVSGFRPVSVPNQLGAARYIYCAAEHQ
jgi:hypothetical protein